ncbi:MAG: RHS repeat-associated core domain-containing protein, partial [Fimbriimonadaceae bacterium]
VYYLHGDQIGSVLAVTNSSAQTVKRWGYTPYGQAVSYTSPGDATTPAFLAGAPEHGYVGQFGVMTDANGLLNMRARYYSPYLRRFLNEDPIGFGGGMNWFGYVGGNPLTSSDPSGLAFPGDHWQNFFTCSYRCSC